MEGYGNIDKKWCIHYWKTNKEKCDICGKPIKPPDKKEKWLGNKVKVKDSYCGYNTGGTGKVVCIVKRKGVKEYIVQFKDDWCHYYERDMEVL